MEKKDVAVTYSETKKVGAYQAPDQEGWLVQHRAKQAQERKEMLEEAKAKARDIGKEPFCLEELEKYWTYRYRNRITRDEYLVDMHEYEEKYYLAGERFMTMEGYGKFLMEMELYR
ncbi:hypothetical protein [Hahella sp. HN01]|uniref:hypothetical protein n=1 Tax=Hahella sp. HN01 TaxID=2847262 RepID=UPI001C1EDEAB|nr:hypothetical protein [Hahella sp. HN01]MBU6955297.1 hypothetical protein [Hahella sp. HN01]